MDGGRTADRNGDAQFVADSHSIPRGGDLSVDRFGGSGNPVEPMNHLGLNANVAVCGSTAAIDAGQYVVEKRSSAREHVMIVRIHFGARALLPELPEGGGAVGQHVSVSGIIGLRQNLIREIGMPTRG